MTSPPGWVLQGAIVDMDFPNARYYGIEAPSADFIPWPLNVSQNGLSVSLAQHVKWYDSKDITLKNFTALIQIKTLSSMGTILGDGAGGSYVTAVTPTTIQVDIYADPITVTLGSGTLTAGLTKIGLSAGSAGSHAVANGGNVVPTTDVFYQFITSSFFDLMSNQGASAVGGFMTRFTLWPFDKTSAEIKSLST